MNRYIDLKEVSDGKLYTSNDLVKVGCKDCAGRCSIHDSRPGLCRLFPLGRCYEDRSFSYFLQVSECRRQNRTKVKVRKWIDMPDFHRYETFLSDWHYFLKDLQKPLEENGPQWEKLVNTEILNQFFFLTYDVHADFYPQFYERLEAVGTQLLSS